MKWMATDFGSSNNFHRRPVPSRVPPFQAWRRRHRSAGMAMDAIGAVKFAASSERQVQEQVFSAQEPT